MQQQFAVQILIDETIYNIAKIEKCDNHGVCLPLQNNKINPGEMHRHSREDTGS